MLAHMPTHTRHQSTVHFNTLTCTPHDKQHESNAQTQFTSQTNNSYRRYKVLTLDINPTKHSSQTAKYSTSQVLFLFFKRTPQTEHDRIKKNVE